jgi:hypothetical protein
VRFRNRGRASQDHADFFDKSLGKWLALGQGRSDMSAQPRIGLACPRPRERAELLEWCSHGFHPIPMIDAGSIVRELDGDGFEALIIDADLAVSGDTPFVLRNLDRNRPIIMIGDADPMLLSDTGRRDVTYLRRPLGREEVLLAVSLALAEGRPARSSPRRLVARLQATVESVPACVIDVSYEGIRLEMPERHRSTLPPFFTVRVPMFGVSVVGKRVWVNNAMQRDADRAFWCGVRLERNPTRATAAWNALVDNAPLATNFGAKPISIL